MPDDEYYSEWDQHSGDDDWYDEGEELYDEMLDNLIERFPDKIDDYAAELMHDVWFDPDTSSFDRAALMFEFFEYTGLGWEDFDWNEWREWYES